MRPGERICVAVSGGADSIALLRLLLELRDELGIVVSVAHFHHGIRGAEADADLEFVAQLAAEHDLEFHSGREDAPRYAAAKRISLETAAHQLRHQFFCRLLAEKKADRIATAHTRDDQAETVLMKFLRGAGTRGLAGVFPEQRLEAGSIVRPLLDTSRAELRAYLRTVGQSWREDHSNTDLSFTRNRVRARVLPMIREELNPSVDTNLSHSAEIARAEEQYWRDQLAKLLPMFVIPGQPARGGGRKPTASVSVSLEIPRLLQQPLALQRRILRAGAEQIGCNLDFEDVQNILDLVAKRNAHGAKGRMISIENGWRARLLFRELRLERADVEHEPAGFEYRIGVPGEVYVPELDTTIRVRITNANDSVPVIAYNRAHLVHISAVPELIIRNWRPGDRFRGATNSSEKRLKELLYPLHLAPEIKKLWPVVTLEDQILWVRGIEGTELRDPEGRRISIEETKD